MLRKFIYLLTLSFIYFPQSFASHTPQDYLSEEPEKVSVNPPNRLGSDELISTVSLTNVKEGPSDEHFSLSPSPIAPVAKGYMVFDEGTAYGYNSPRKPWEPYTPESSQVVKERISTFGIARLTFDSYLEQCKELGSDWSKLLAPLRVELNPHDTVCKRKIRNAYYQRTDKEGGQGVINFCSKGLSTAKIFDVVAHEVGHSILDALQNTYYNNLSLPHYGAIHESFGDLSAFFASVHLAKLINRPDLIPTFIKNDDFCLAPGLNPSGSCLRKPSTYTGSSCKAHDHSNYFTSFIISSMRTTFRGLDNTIQENYNAEWVSNFFQRLLIYTVVSIPNFDSLYTFSDQMIKNVSTLITDSALNTLIRSTMRNEIDKHLPSLSACGVPHFSLSVAAVKSSLFSPFSSI